MDKENDIEEIDETIEDHGMEIVCRSCQSSNLEFYHDEECGSMARCYDCGDSFCTPWED